MGCRCRMGARARADAHRVSAQLARRLGAPAPGPRVDLRLAPSAEVAALALGDPDAVPVGDYHLPALVAWNIAGERTADDARMLELLEPYRPHRYRTIRLVSVGGDHPQRRGPRRVCRDFARL